MDKTTSSNQLLSENKLYSLNSTCNFCALKNLQSIFQEKIWTWTGIRTSDLQITSVALLPIELSKFPFQFMFETINAKRFHFLHASI